MTMLYTLIALIPWKTAASVLGKTLSVYGLYILGGLLLVAGIALYAPSKQEIVVIDDSQVTAQVSTATASQLLVDIAGAVQKPGVYKLSSEAIVADAIIVAGGFATEADIDAIHSSLNLSESLHDRQKVYIPTVTSASSLNKNSDMNIVSRSISVNTASQKELQSLPGIGAVRATNIVEGRPYSELYELVEKEVVTESVYEKLKGELSL